MPGRAKGATFVIEADEYDRMFLGLKPTIEVVTNIEYDHPDCYPTPADFQAAFVEFMSRISRQMARWWPAPKMQGPVT